jgi:hypothetical protein
MSQNNDSKPTKTKAPLEDISKDQILAFKSQAGKIHQIEAFGGTVYIKEWTSQERDRFEGSMIIGKGKRATVTIDNIRAKMFVRSVCDKNGTLIFADKDAEEIGSLPAAEVEKVYAKCQEVNSVSDEDVEELAGN